MARRPSPIGPALQRPRTDIMPKPVPASMQAAKPTKPTKVRGIFLGGYVDPDTKVQFKQLLAKRRLTEQAALEEMLNDYFSKHGVHRIAGSGGAPD